MLSLTTRRADRVEALRKSFRGLAAPLLSDEKPGDESLGLLILVIADAALSGDRTLLAGAEETIDRLESYLDQDAEWAREFRGRLWSLKHFVGLCHVLLVEGERLAGARSELS